MQPCIKSYFLYELQFVDFLKKKTIYMKHTFFLSFDIDKDEVQISTPSTTTEFFFHTKAKMFNLRTK